MIKTILVGYDGTSGRADAVALADALATPRAATVVDPGPTPAESLGALAETRDSDLIVTGSSRRARTGGVLPDEGVQALIAAPSRPVAIAPRGFEHSSTADLRQIGVAYDGSAGARAALALAADLVAGGSGWLELLAVAEPRLNGNGRPSRADLERVVAEALAEMHDRIHVLPEVAYGIPTRTLLNRTAALDLFALGARAEVAGDALGSVATGLIVGGASCPVLIAPPAGHDRSPGRPLARLAASLQVPLQRGRPRGRANRVLTIR
jgi:nucleotide-binding universal stress UspA family protein